MFCMWYTDKKMSIQTWRGDIMRESFISSGEDERIDNYDVVCDNWRKLYQAMDKEELRERFQLEMDEQAMYLTFYNKK